MKKLPAQPNKGLIDGISVLREMASRGSSVSCTELSSALGIEKTKVSRILKTLAYLGIVKSAPGRKYVPGEGMHVLAAQSISGSGLLNASIKHLAELNKLGYVVALGVLWRDMASYLYHHSPQQNTIEGLGRHGSIPIGGSSVGMAIIAQKSDEEILSTFPDKHVEGFSGTFDDFLSTISQIRKNGYSNMCFKENHYSLAVTVGSPTPYAAIALAGDIKTEQVNDLVSLMKRTSELIERDIKF